MSTIEEKSEMKSADEHSLPDAALAAETLAVSYEPALPPKESSEFNLRSILVLSAAAFGLFNTAGLLNAFGVFQAFYSIHYLPNESNFDISWIGSFSIFMLFALGTPAGMLSDRYGPILPVGIGIVCEVLALFMISLCKEYYQFFLAQGVLLGFGMSFILIPIAALPPLYFKRNRGLAQGICIGGSSLGGVLWPIMLDQLLNKDKIGFGWTLRVVAFVALALFAIVLVGIRHPSIQKAADKTSTEGIDAEEAAAQEKENKNKLRKEGVAKLKHPSFIFLCGGLAIYYFGFFVPFFFVTEYGISLGVSESFSIYLISILNSASLFGRILPGYVSDRFGHFNILCISMYGSCLVCFCWTAVNSVAGLVLWSLAYGFISGAVLSLQLACASLLTNREAVGTAFGLVMFSIALTALFGTPIAGEIIKSGYLVLSMYCGAVMVLGAILVTVARLYRSRDLLAKV